METLSGKYNGYKLTIKFNKFMSPEEKSHLSTLISKELKLFGQTVDRNDSESEVFKFNTSGNLFTGTDEFFDYFSDAMHWFGITDGVFNPFVTSILDDVAYVKNKSGKDSKFGLDSVTSAFPKKVSQMSDFIKVDYTNNRIQILRPVKLDLHGLSKGKFVDKLVKRLSPELHYFSVQFGGDAYFKTNGNEEPWGIKITNPVTGEKGILTMQASNEAISVSGKLGQKKILEAGEDYALLNPGSQQRVESDLAMVIIKTDISSKADVLAKTFFIATEQERNHLSKKFPEIQKVEINSKGEMSMG